MSIFPKLFLRMPIPAALKSGVIIKILPLPAIFAIPTPCAPGLLIDPLIKVDPCPNIAIAVPNAAVPALVLALPVIIKLPDELCTILPLALVAGPAAAAAIKLPLIVRLDDPDITIIGYVPVLVATFNVPFILAEFEPDIIINGTNTAGTTALDADKLAVTPLFK